MSKNIYVRIIKRNRQDGTWKQIKLFYKDKDNIKPVDIYPYQNYELFDILSGNENDSFPYSTIIKNDLPYVLIKEINKYQSTFGYYCCNFSEINLADLKLYLQKVPKVRDYDYEDIDPKAWKDNPVKGFIEHIESYLDFADPYWNFDPYSDIKIIYWFDY